MTSSQVAPIQLRSLLYEWLATAFFIPTTEATTTDYAEAGRHVQTMLFPDMPADLFESLEQASREAVHPDTRLQELKLEYSRLFLGPPQGVVHPYESIYCGEDRLMTHQSLAAAEFYRDHGIEFDPEGYREPPDHVAVELEFLAMVCAGEIRNGTPEEVERTFIADHLGQWGFLLAHDVRAASQDPLYRTAATLLEAVLTTLDAGNAATTD